MRELDVSDAHNQRGALLVLVGCAMTALLALSALVIDMGHNFGAKRQLESATDAAALAAAQAYGRGGAGCPTVAADYLLRNAPGAQLVRCDTFGDLVAGTEGWVVVEAERDVDQFLAGSIGFDTVSVASTSGAWFGSTAGSTSPGTWPVALCGAALINNAGFLAWQLLGDPTAVSTNLRIMYNDFSTLACGPTGGKAWALLDLDGGVSTEEDLGVWLALGYADQLDLGWQSQSPLTLSGNHEEALQSIIDGEQTFFLPLVSALGGLGSLQPLEVTSLVAVRLTDFRITGLINNRYLEFVIDPTVVPGSGPVSTTAGPPSTRLVAVADDGTPIGAN